MEVCGMTVTDYKEKKDRMTEVWAGLVIFALCLALALTLTPSSSYADAKSPPDESIPSQDESAEQEAIKKKEEAARAARIAREKRAAAARRRAAEAARRAAAEKAEAEKRAAEAARRLASEDMISRPIVISRNLVETGRYWSAVRVLRSYLDEYPQSADAWYVLSRAHHALGDYDSAQRAVNNALDIDPYYPDLVKTPNGLQPAPVLSKEERKEPRPSMSVLPVKQPLPANLLLEPVVVSFPILVEAERQEGDEYINSLLDPDGYDPLTGAYLQYTPYPPHPLGATVRWMQSEKFNEISRWRFRVDRMGILMEPRVPIAWKGDRPYEIYFWTGTEWARVRREERKYENGETFDDILYRARDSIAEVLRDRGFLWYEPDTPSLAANASLMRYKWVGDVDLLDAALRAEKRAAQAAVTAAPVEKPLEIVNIDNAFLER
jgi:tetratricopeptide (TPR) repeat protein